MHLLFKHEFSLVGKRRVGRTYVLAREGFVDRAVTNKMNHIRFHKFLRVYLQIVKIILYFIGNAG